MARDSRRLREVLTAARAGVVRPRALSAREVAAGLALLAGLAVLALAHDVFPYHSLNHDEGVYLQQAGMLLEGKLALRPPVPEAFRPWFFVADGAGGFYPKYAPVPAGMFAVGGAVGWYRLALGLIAAGTVWLTYATVAEAVGDRRVGALAAGLVLASPLFLVQAAVFLPYVPTLCLELLFAWALLRAERTGSRPLAALAGAAIGLAFFARPWTAVLFAAPFVGFTLWRLRRLERGVIERAALTAGLGLAGVALALWYNAVVTGAALTFPYEAFAPADGLGFGHRAILGHEVEYTPVLAARAAVANLVAFLTDWVVAAPLGGLLALGGVGVAVRRHASDLDARTLAVAGLFVTVPVGEALFWGTLNVLGDPDTAGDGLVAVLGPYYHLDLLVPTAAFGALGLVRGGEWLVARRDAIDGSFAGRRRAVVAAALVLLAGLAGAATVGAIADPLSANGEVTAGYEAAYDAVESRDLDRALVYLPTPYGNWLNHPFQHLRNDPGYDGDVVYALDTAPHPVADAFPERQLYRYSYRGRWDPAAGETVTPVLRRVRRAAGDPVVLDVTAGVPAYAEVVSVRVDSDAGEAAATVVEPGRTLSLAVAMDTERATVSGPGLDEPLTVRLEDRDTLDLRLLVDFGGVDALPYHLAVPLAVENGVRQALSPRLEVCAVADRCGGEAAYIPGAYRDGVHLNASFRGGTDG